SNSPCSKCSSLPRAAWSAPKSCWNGRGMRTPTRSPTPCASPFRRCANASENPGLSPRSLASGTASTRRTMDRAPGLSVRLKLTLSYAGLLMLAGSVALVAAWVFVLRYVPNGAIYTDRGLLPTGEVTLRGSLWDVGRIWLGIELAAFGPAAAMILAFLLAFGLVGGWF